MRPATLLLVFGLVLVGCGGLPPDFESLPLEEKVEAYEQHFLWGGSSLTEGRSYISWHGQEAAALMIPFLQESHSAGLPRHEALMIIWLVQLRGCDLRGTAAERAIRTLLKDEELPWNLRLAADGAIKAITEGSHLEPGQVDGLTGGPCEKELAARDTLGDGDGESG